MAHGDLVLLADQADLLAHLGPRDLGDQVDQVGLVDLEGRPDHSAPVDQPDLVDPVDHLALAAQKAQVDHSDLVASKDQLDQSRQPLHSALGPAAPLDRLDQKAPTRQVLVGH